MFKLCVFVFSTVLLLFVSAKEEIYSNSWAVEVKGGHHVANALAEKHGFVNKGQVGSIEGVYHFVHKESPNRERRSTDTLHPKHAHLAAEEDVSYVEQQVVKIRAKREHTFVYSSPTDSKWGSQWYLHRPSSHDMNIERAWEQDVIGRGAVVSILDDGIEHTHPDLKDNYDPQASYDFNSHDADPFPRYDYSNENKHGTRCAGEVAANKDGKCGVGAAYGSKVGGVRMLDGDVTDVVEASSLSLNPQHIHIYSSSWGPSDDGATIDGPGPLAKKAFLDGINKGRGGLGSLFVWAAGNGGRYGDSCNCDGYAVSPYTISVGSASEKDAIPWYLEKCSSTLVSTYSSGGSSEKQIVSTDLHSKCTVHHTGTSAAAPLAAGILALALEANANLTWRDVQYLLVYTSNPHYPNEPHWLTNGAGLRVSHMFGFGIIDATALVNRARNWITVPPRVNCSVNSTKTLGSDSVATTGQSLSITAVFPTDCAVSYIEHTQAFVTLKLLAGQRKDVSISLSSPQGTKSVLLPFRKADRHSDGIHSWPFMTVLTWGEAPTGGDWVFTVSTQRGAKAQLLGLELAVHGTHGTPRALREVPTDCHSECKGGCSAPGSEFCDDCKHVRLSSTLACVETCPPGTFENHHMCRECPDLCEECTDMHNCVKCADGAVRLDSGLCAKNCPPLTYLAQDHTCHSCHHSCLSCEGPTERNCTKCPGQFSLEEGQCVIRNPESCSTRQYFDHRALECRSCHVSCQNCSGKESDRCTACYGDYTLTAAGRCEESLPTLDCEHRTYFDRESSSCGRCPVNCTSCSSNVTCTQCDGGLYLTTSGGCVERCPNRTITNNKTHTCLDTHCSENCLTCYGADADSCTSCEEGALLLGSSCVTKCPAHTFSPDNSTCQHCNVSCATCDGPSTGQCLSCPEGKLLYQNQCLSDCPSGSFLSDVSCLPCLANCAQCSSSTSCAACEKGHFLNSLNHCVTKCPEGTVAHPATKTCRACPAHCLECYNTESCHTCEDNFVYYAPNRSCQSQCPDGYYFDSNANECSECKHPCSTCEGKARNCLSCQINMVFDAKRTEKCLHCCDVDHPKDLPCCDCDLSTSECVQRDSLVTPEPVSETSGKGGHKFLLSVVIAVIFALLVVSALLVTVYLVRMRRREYAGAVKRYKVLGKEPLEIVDDSGLVEIVDDSGSEVEVFTSRNSKGYTSVDTIDHDQIHQDVS